MTKLSKLLGALLLNALLMTGTAQAGVITVSGMSYANPTQVSISSASPSVNQRVYAGAFNTSDGTKTFLSWCVDIFQDTRFGVQVTDYTLKAGALVLGEQKINALGSLATEALGLVTNAVSSGAFQLAIWEIINENVGTSYNLQSGNFRVSNASDASISLAQTWLNNLPTNSNYTVDILASPTRQDLAVFKRAEVPEPGTLLLLGLGALALGFNRRLKFKQ